TQQEGNEKGSTERFHLSHVHDLRVSARNGGLHADDCKGGGVRARGVGERRGSSGQLGRIAGLYWAIRLQCVSVLLRNVCNLLSKLSWIPVLLWLQLSGVWVVSGGLRLCLGSNGALAPLFSFKPLLGSLRRVALTSALRIGDRIAAP